MFDGFVFVLVFFSSYGLYSIIIDSLNISKRKKEKPVCHNYKEIKKEKKVYDLFPIIYATVDITYKNKTKKFRIIKENDIWSFVDDTFPFVDEHIIHKQLKIEELEKAYNNKKMWAVAIVWKQKMNMKLGLKK